MHIFYVNYGQAQHQYQPKLKDQLIKIFGDKILFLIPDNNMHQVILQRNSLIEQSVSSALKLHSVTALTENSTNVSCPLTFVKS